MTSRHPDPRPMLTDLWRASGLTSTEVAGRMGERGFQGDAGLAHLRRVLSGYLHPACAEQVRAILDALDLRPADHGRQAYVLAYLRWANFPEMVGLDNTLPAPVSAALATPRGVDGGGSASGDR